MKTRSLRRLLVCFCCALTTLVQPNSTRAAPAAVVGTGTPASCTEAALNAALVLGGDITFDCGAALHSIVLTTYKGIAIPTSIDGGGKITLSGNNTNAHFQVFSSAALTLTNIELRNGKSTAGFGSIQNFGRLFVNNAAFVANDGGTSDGGAIANIGQVLIVNSLFLSNTANAKFGGAVASSGDIVVRESLFISNTAKLGGAVYLSIGAAMAGGELVFRNNTGFDGGALYISSDVTATIRNSEFSENSAAYGGAIEVWGTLNMTNTTLSNNRAQNDGGGIWLVNTTIPSTIDHSTLYGNRAINGANLNSNGAQVKVQGSVFGRTQGITTTNCVAGTGVDIGVTNIADDATCGTAAVHADLKLGPLKNNGGVGKTHLPQLGSPLIDAVLTCPKRDQRDVVRPQGPRCDIGAVEVFQGKFYLPVALQGAIPPSNGTTEIEPNNLAAQANGPIQLGVDYKGFPDDANDYFKFVMPSAGQVTLSLTGHSGEPLNLLQLQLRDASDAQITFAFATPFKIITTVPAGTYYARIFYAAPGPYNTATQYTLRVSSP